MSLQSDTLRDIVAKLESDLASSGERLVRADRANQDTTRALILVPNDKKAQSAANVAQAEQNAARQAHERIASTILEARRMLSEALASEEAARIEALKTQVRELVPGILAASDEADEALATYLGRVARARSLEEDAHRVLAQQLGTPVFGGAVVGEALYDAAAHVRGVRTGTADPLGPLTRARADAAAIRISRALGDA